MWEKKNPGSYTYIRGLFHKAGSAKLGSLLTLKWGKLLSSTLRKTCVVITDPWNCEMCRRFRTELTHNLAFVNWQPYCRHGLDITCWCYIHEGNAICRKNTVQQYSVIAFNSISYLIKPRKKRGINIYRSTFYKYSSKFNIYASISLPDVYTFFSFVMTHLSDLSLNLNVNLSQIQARQFNVGSREDFFSAPLSIMWRYRLSYELHPFSFSWF